MSGSISYRTGLLASVTAVHVGALWWLLSGFVQERTTQPTPLPMVRAEMLPAPQPKTEARPQPESKPEPKPAPKAPTPKPVPKTTKSDKALSAPKAEQPAQAAPAAEPVSTPPAPAAPLAPPAPPAPLSPPRFNAAYLNNPLPAYPPILRRSGEEGKVMLRVFVTPEGTAGEVRVLTPSSSPLFDEAAVNAVRKWRFVPARRGDMPVAEWVQVPIEFKLN